jgi:hypothetical protein
MRLLKTHNRRQLGQQGAQNTKTTKQNTNEQQINTPIDNGEWQTPKKSEKYKYWTRSSGCRKQGILTNLKFKNIKETTDRAK